MSKVCIKCHQLKPLEEFSIRNPLTQNRRGECVSCMRLYFRRYKKQTRDDPAKTWYWCSRAQSINGAAKKRYGITSRISTTSLRVKFQSANKCWLCGKPITVLEAWLDHTIPLSRGGEHTIENLELFCKVCNELKNTLLLSELFEHIKLILRNHNQ